MMNPVSVKDRLKNQAKSSERTMQDELVTYGLERTIYRLSVSDYAERFTLKGGIFLYALFDGNFTQAIEQVKKLLMPIVESIEKNEDFNYNWDKDRKEWK